LRLDRQYLGLGGCVCRARGIRCAVILPEGKIASGKLVQAYAYGAKVVAIDGNFDDALRVVRELGQRADFAIVNSINPDRIAGQKTAAYEIVEELGDAPDLHLLPVGNAGNITAYWAGYREFAELGRATKRPAMLGFRRRDPRRSSTAKSSISRRQLRRRSGSETRRAGTAQRRRSATRQAPSTL
jgi:threonine synthase